METGDWQLAYNYFLLTLFCLPRALVVSTVSVLRSTVQTWVYSATWPPIS
jgi:hypothetical protein